MRVHLVSLGCAKNRVDSEVMLGLLRAAGHEIVADPDAADAAIVNTCTFIEPATEESVDAVLRLGERRESGQLQRLVVTGCMAQRYPEQLAGELAEVDHFLGTGEYHRIVEALAGQVPRTVVDTPRWLPDAWTPRLNTSPPGSAWLKISEGCDHRCAFCIIPSIRGRHRSRTVASLVAEAERLADEGVVELNVVGQDTTAYGRDLRDGTDLSALLRALARVDGLRWIRVHYAWPRDLPADLLRVMADEDKVLPYLDIPLQHASTRVLKAMRRGVSRGDHEALLARVRSVLPDVTLRTTFIVGFPGETEADFDGLVEFVEAQRFHHVGVFPYYAEVGTRAAQLAGQVPEPVRAERRAELMALQQLISREHWEGWVGRTVSVLVEGPSPESDLVLVGRTASQAPEVDGQVILTETPADVVPGTIRSVEIVDAAEYDLVGRVV